MHHTWLVIVAFGMLVTTPLIGQGPRSGGGGQRSSGQMAGQNRAGSQQGTAQQQTMHSQQEMRLRSQATDAQRAAMKQTITSTQRLRTQLRTITRLKKGEQIGVEEAKLWREQIRTQFQAMIQEQQVLLGSLSEDQLAWVSDDVQDIDEAKVSLDELLDVLTEELEQPEIDEQAVKETARKADDKTKKIENEEKQILSELGL